MTLVRDELLTAIAERIADYRSGEVAPMTPAHVDRWVRQFAPSDQITILEEMRHLLNAYYVSRADARFFLRGFLSNPSVFGKDIRAGLLTTRFLNTQRKGQSQRDLLILVDEILREDYELSLVECGLRPKQYVYLDDCLFTGDTLYKDLEATMRRMVQKTTLHLVLIAAYWRKFDGFRRQVEALAEAFEMTIKYWRAHEFIDLPDVPTRYDALWPLETARDAAVDEYIKSRLGTRRRERYLFRPEGVPHEDRLFSSATARDVVERAFVQAGARLVMGLKYPQKILRPLGYELEPSLGFGAFFVTYRNCPNNCPLVLWWGDADARPGQALANWYPLFPRKTHTISEAERGLLG